MMQGPFLKTKKQSSSSVQGLQGISQKFERKENQKASIE